MVEHESDGINEAFQSSARAWLTAGGLVAERLVRAREQQLRDAQAISEQATREARKRLDAQRATDRASLKVVSREAWWERASPEQIGVAWETAQAWRDSDPVAAGAARQIGERLRDRWAIDVDSLGADPGAVRDALDKRERALRLSEQAREKQRGDEAAADELVVQADRADRAQEDRRAEAQRAEQPTSDGADRGAADALYDSAERRAAMAEQLGEIADEETVEAVVTADITQGRPAQDAVDRVPARAPVARRGRGRGAAKRGATRRSERGR